MSERIGMVSLGCAKNQVNAEQMREIYTLMPMGGEVTSISKEDHERMKEITIQQLRRGGYRLAKVLNDIFDK